MTPDDVERLAMELPGTVIDPHWGKLGFHRQRLFALIHDDTTLYLRLSLVDRSALLDQNPAIFSRFSGMGPDGLTVVALDKIDAATLRASLEMAWRNAEAPQH